MCKICEVVIVYLLCLVDQLNINLQSFLKCSHLILTVTAMRRLYVGGLSHTVTEKDLKDRFGKFGAVEDVELRTRKDPEGEESSIHWHTLTTRMVTVTMFKFCSSNFIHVLRLEITFHIQHCHYQVLVQLLYWKASDINEPSSIHLCLTLFVKS